MEDSIKIFDNKINSSHEDDNLACLYKPLDEDDRPDRDDDWHLDPDRLYRHLDPVCWKTEITLARELGVSWRQIRKAKETLEEERKIVITYLWNGTRRNPRHVITKLGNKRRTLVPIKSINGSCVVDPVVVSQWSDLRRMDLIELYLKSNWQIIPLTVRGKHPVMNLRLWRQVSNSRDSVLDYFWRHENQNIGMVVQNMTVIDLDTKVIPDDFYCTEFDNTLTSETGNGFHFFFKADPVIKSSVKIFSDVVDTRCSNSFVTLPPSVHESGFTYRWVTCDGLANLPIRIRRAWQKNYFERGLNKQAFRLPAVIAEGARNDTLFRFGRSLRKHGKSFDEIVSEINQANTLRCKPSLGSTELRCLIRSVWNSPDRDDFKV